MLMHACPLVEILACFKEYTVSSLFLTVTDISSAVREISNWRGVAGTIAATPASLVANRTLYMYRYPSITIYFVRPK
jgi:Flp pilus assembly protein protease CpaA